MITSKIFQGNGLFGNIGLVYPVGISPLFLVSIYPWSMLPSSEVFLSLHFEWSSKAQNSKLMVHKPQSPLLRFCLTYSMLFICLFFHISFQDNPDFSWNFGYLKNGMLAIKDWSLDAAGLDRWDMGVWVPPAPPGRPHSCSASSWPLLAFELVPCLLTSDPNLCCSPIQILPWLLCHSCRKPPREASQHCPVLSRSGASPTHHLFLYCLQAKDGCEIFK